MRHLLFHVTPLGNWRWNLDMLLKRIHLFDGVKYVAVAQGKTKDGDTLLDFHEVRKFLPLDIRVVPVANDVVLRETASLAPLLSRLANSPISREGITFYGHTKGASRQEEPIRMREAIRLWTEIMYVQNLDNIKDVEADLKDHPCTGCFKRYGRFGHFPRTSHWHYSGTFFWFRNRDLFERDWLNVPKSRYGAEAYLSTLFSADEAGCIFGDGINDLYNIGYLRRVLGIPDGSPKKHVARTGKTGVNPRLITGKKA